MAARPVQECPRCGYQCPVAAGTTFHQTPAPLTSWFWAACRTGQGKKSVSAVQSAKEIGVGYPTAG